MSTRWEAPARCFGVVMPAPAVDEVAINKSGSIKGSSEGETGDDSVSVMTKVACTSRILLRSSDGSAEVSVFSVISVISDSRNASDGELLVKTMERADTRERVVAMTTMPMA